MAPQKIITNSSLTFPSIFWEIRSRQHKVSGTLEWCFNFSNHVSQVIKSTRVQTRDLYRIRPLLDLNTSVLLANTLVSNGLDYCNSLFLSLTDSELRRLQLVQNSLCRLVTRSSKFSHITHQLKNSIGFQSETGYNSKLVLLHTKFSTRANQFT